MGPLESNDRGLIKLDSYTRDGFTLGDYDLTMVFDDIILVQFTDLSEDGTTIFRNGIVLPINTVQKAWRIGRVILAGPNCKFTKVDNFVCFPNDKGIPVSNITVAGLGVLKNAIFLNEDRIFGICTPREHFSTVSDESPSVDVKKHTSKKRSRN